MERIEYNCSTGESKIIQLTQAEIATLPPPPTLREAKDKRIAYINAEADKKLHQLVAGYPMHEVSTWHKQVQEAEAYALNPLASTPTLTAIAEGAGVTVLSIADTVLQKAAALGTLTGQIIGKRKAKTAEIEACLSNDNGELEVIVW